MSLEREVKLQVSPDLVLPSLDELAPGTTASEPSTAHTTTVYVDTDDLRLARWGWSLRHRDDDGWTLKVPEPSQGPVLARMEHRFEGGADEVPAAALDLAAAVSRGEPLAPVARLDTTRRLVRLLDNGSTVAEVVDDRVRVESSPAGPSVFREVEVELLEDRRDVLDALLRRLDAAGASTGPAPSKYDRALGGRPEPEVPDDEVGDGATIRDVVRAAIGGSVRRLIVNDPGVRVGEEPEAVHQARVAVRRLRSDLKTFGPWTDRPWADLLREDLKWIADLLGAVRDADVMIDRLRRRVDELPEGDRNAGRDLIGKLATSRDEHRAELLLAMRDERYPVLIDRLVDAAREPVLLADAATAPASDASAVMRRPWRRLELAVAAIGTHPSDAELHTVRISTKRVRYAAEALAAVSGKAARRFAERAADLQDVLGEHQDAVVAQAWLRKAAGRGRRASFVAGELAAAERRAAEETAAAWPSAWQRLSRKRMRFW